MGGGRETGNGTAMWLATTTEQVRFKSGVGRGVSMFWTGESALSR